MKKDHIKKKRMTALYRMKYRSYQNWGDVPDNGKPNLELTFKEVRRVSGEPILKLIKARVIDADDE